MAIKKTVILLSIVFSFLIPFAQPTHLVLDVEKKYKEARSFVNQNDFEQAYPLLKELKNQYPDYSKSDFSYIKDDVDYFYIVCELHLQLSIAEKDANNYIAESNNKFRIQELCFHLGHYYFINKDFQKAADFFSRTKFEHLSKEEMINAKFENGYALFNIKKFSEAKILFADLISLVSIKYYLPANYYYGFISYGDKDYESALQSFRLVEKVSEYNQVVPYYVAEILYLQNKKQESLEYGESVLSAGGDLYYKSNLQLLVAQLYFEKENFSKALPFFEQHVNDNDKVSKEVMYDLSFCYYKTNNTTKAIEGFKQLSNERDSMGQNSMYLLGSLYLNINDKANARSAFQYSAYNSTNKIQQKISRFNYAKLSYELGFQDVALNEIKQFISDYPNSEYEEEAKLILVNILANTNNFTEGLAVYATLNNPTLSQQKVYAKLLYGKAIQLINDQQINDADGLLNSILKNTPASIITSYAAFWKGEIAYRQQKYDTCISFTATFLDSKVPPQGEANFSHAKYNLGYSYFQKEQFKLALTQFSLIVIEPTINSTSIEQDVFVRMADCNFMLKDYANANLMYDKVILLKFPQSDYALFQKAMIVGVKSSLDKINLLAQLSSSFPNSNLLADAQFEMALTYIADENFSKAIPYLKRLTASNQALSIRPKVFLKLGLAYYNNNDNLNAIDAFKDLIKNYPKSNEAEEALPIVKDIYLEEGTTDDYFALLRANKIAVNIIEADSLAYQASYKKYQNNEAKIAINSLNSYLTRYSNGAYVVDANYYLGICYEKEKDFKKAITAYGFVSVQGLSEYFESATLQLGRIYYFESHDYLNAKKSFQLLLANGNNEENKLEALRGLVRTCFQLKAYDEANIAAKDLLTKKGISTDDKAIASLVLGKSQLSIKDTLAAIESFKLVMLINKAAWGAQARYELASSYFLLNNLLLAEKYALAVIKETSSYDYWVAKSYILLGDVFLKKKDYFNAKATYESVAKNTSVKELKDEATEKLVLVEIKEQQSSKINNK